MPDPTLPQAPPVVAPVAPEPEPQFTLWERFREYAGVLALVFSILALGGVFMIDRATHTALNGIAEDSVSQIAAVQSAPAGKPVQDIAIAVHYDPFDLTSIFGWIGSNLLLVGFLALLGYIIYDKRKKNRRRPATNGGNANPTP